MNKLCFVMFFVVCIFSQSLAIRPIIQNENRYNVFDYGAKGDGETDDTQVFLEAWADVCGASGSIATLSVPQGHSFLLQPLAFKGPCAAATINFELLGTMVAPNGPKEWNVNNKNPWIQFVHVKGLVINGKYMGTIDGKGSSWWGNEVKSLNPEEAQANDAGSRPTALYFHGCDGLSINETNHINSARNHITINGCNGVDINTLRIVAPEDSPNTDGINISQSTNVRVKDSVIETGDDCIAISNGTSAVHINGIVCGPGHGISIGSLGQNRGYEIVEDVYVTNCTFKGTQNGVRIKTWQGGSGYARRISFEGIRFEDVRNPIIIDQFYSSRTPDSQTKNSAVFISNIKFSQMQGTSASEEAIKLKCSDEKGCVNIQMDHIKLVASSKASSSLGKELYSTCYNAHGTSSFVIPDVHCLS